MEQNERCECMRKLKKLNPFDFYIGMTFYFIPCVTQHQYKCEMQLREMKGIVERAKLEKAFSAASILKLQIEFVVRVMECFEGGEKLVDIVQIFCYIIGASNTEARERIKDYFCSYFQV